MTDEIVAGLIALAVLAIGTASTAITLIVRPWIVRRGYRERELLAKDIAKTAVRMVEQTMEGASSSAKYDAALTYADNMGDRNDLDFTEREWRGFLEEAVHNLRLDWDFVGAPPLATLSTARAKTRRAPNRSRDPNGRFRRKDG